jgi:hypothetical protein
VEATSFGRGALEQAAVGRLTPTLGEFRRGLGSALLSSAITSSGNASTNAAGSITCAWIA